MPLPFAHPAAVLPLRRWCQREDSAESNRGWLIFPALLIGSVSPDSAYYWPNGLPQPSIFHTYANPGFSHTIQGTIIYGVPVGMIFLALFYYVVRRPLFAMLPQRAHLVHLAQTSRSPFRAPFWGSRRILLVPFSIWIGAFTHIVWDAITHGRWRIWINPGFDIIGQGYFVQEIPSLYITLQVVCTIFGVIVVLIYYLYWYKDISKQAMPTTQADDRIPSGQRWWLLTILLSGCGAIFLLKYITDFSYFNKPAGDEVNQFIVAGRHGIESIILTFIAFVGGWHGARFLPALLRPHAKAEAKGLESDTV